ncbi:MBL fold metallo-hydrolase [bacterium]|jgi:hydroxyacylglutathione hydrolase|nr:MBL fold metallo-hydrolase [bacterium]
MILEQLPLGPMANFIYILGDSGTKKVAIVDPAWDVPAILHRVEQLGATLESVLLTHGHHDHVNGLEELLERHSVPVYLSEHEAEFYTPEVEGLVRTKDMEVIHVGDLAIECIHAPGHTPGGQCFRMGNHMITGDTLFVGACGRTDLPGGNTETLYETLDMLKTLPDETIIYPGHAYGDATTDTIGNQKLTNPFLYSRNQTEFSRKRNWA